MAVCRYFQQGTCRFGDRCRYEHVYVNNNTYGSGYVEGNYPGANNYGGYANYNYSSGHGSGGGDGNIVDRGGTSILRAKSSSQYQQPNSSYFGQPVTPSQPNTGFFSRTPDQKPAAPQREIKDIMQMIINDFVLWERSGQWPLSCYSLSKEQDCFPGLIDYSPEEIRWLVYQARASGNIEACQLQLKEIYEQSKRAKERLMTPSAELLELLTRLAKGEKLGSSSALSNPSKPSVNVFNNSAGGNVLQSAQGQVQFTFSLPNQPSSPANNTNTSIFGTPQGNLMNQNASIFGTSQGNTGNQNPSIFGGSQGNMNNQNTSVFGAPQGSMFPNEYANTTLGNAAVPSSTSNVFKGPHQVANSPLHINSQSVGGMFSKTSAANMSEMYSPLKELSEDAINAFKAPVLKMGSVPLQPPPKELCGFKT